MPIRDFNMDWLENKLFLAVPVQGLAEVTTPTVLRTWQSVTSITAQIAASTATIIRTSVTNDGTTWLLQMPYDFDINKAMRFRAHYSQTATSGTVTWQVRYTPIIATLAGTVGATVIAAPATLLSTPIPAASGTVVANDYRVTDFGQINRGVFIDTTEAIILETRTTDGAPVAGLGLIGLEVRYTPRRLNGPRRNILGGRRLVTSRPLGVQMATAQEGL